MGRGHLGGIWEASRKHPGGLRESSGGGRPTDRPWGSGGIKVAPLPDGMQKVPENVDFARRFER